MKTISSITGIAIMLSASVTAFANPHIGISSTFVEKSSANNLPVISVLNGVDGQNAEVVYTPTGSFYTDNNGNWTEQGNDGKTFNFRETGRDASSVYLRDDSRGVNLQLNLKQRQIYYSDDRGQSFALYRITDAQARSFGNNNGQIGNAYSASVVEYTCNEGIPLIIEYENIGNDSWATWNHDGFQGNKLPSVISGSGVKYTDGRNTVWSKGDNVYINLDGIEDSCSSY